MKPNVNVVNPTTALNSVPAAVAQRGRLALRDDVVRHGDGGHERAECEAAKPEVLLLLHETLRDQLVSDGLFGAVEGHHRLEVSVVGLKYEMSSFSSSNLQFLKLKNSKDQVLMHMKIPTNEGIIPKLTILGCP